MRDYYTGRLAGRRLRRVYEIAPPRVQQYLEAEIAHVRSRLPRRGRVLELGCGYGRVAFRLAEVCRPVIGIDTSIESLMLARAQAIATLAACRFLSMDAVDLAFGNHCFDAVVCVQNGICAFGVDPIALLREAVRVTRIGGLVIFSSYADAFWPHRFEWFRQQAAEGLVGEIDYDRSRDGVIVCRDGFRAGTMRPDAFRRLCAELDADASIAEVDASSVFCEIQRGSDR